MVVLLVTLKRLMDRKEFKYGKMFPRVSLGEDVMVLDTWLKTLSKNLIYEAEAPHNRAENQIIEAARAEAAAARADAEAARAEVAAARADADAARAEAAASTARTRSLEIKFEEFQSRMMALETASCSGHSRQSSHPHYDNELDDQSVDEEEDA
ncbi:unnamed protein product [Trifolium pratense]|uniref:Uncharacterized protein n=1 Tax=Trifolium pratense TaxID=57577 RepID=A0ACB0JNS4_TRIPR|nr:unnamed protein product [Trifolium pratense]